VSGYVREEDSFKTTKSLQEMWPVRTSNYIQLQVANLIPRPLATFNVTHRTKKLGDE